MKYIKGAAAFLIVVGTLFGGQWILDSKYVPREIYNMACAQQQKDMSAFQQTTMEQASQNQINYLGNEITNRKRELRYTIDMNEKREIAEEIQELKEQRREAQKHLKQLKSK